jgi:glycosyltransferase involved in cell wall biosynthesis
MTVKIAFFLPALDGGGAEKVFVTLANSLVNIDYQVDFVLASASGVHLTGLDPKITQFDLGQKHVISAFLGLGSYLRDQKPQIIFSALSNANAAAIAASRLFLPSCQAVITQHVSWVQVLANNSTRKERIVYQLSKFLYPFAARIVAVSTSFLDEIKSMKNVDPEKVLCIYNPVVTSRLLELAQKQPDHPWLTLKTRPIILGVGRLVEQKDFTTLIRAFSNVQSQIECKLLILGDGPERQKLEKLVANLGLAGKVSMPGFSSNPYAIMANADLFVLSSRFEGLPTVLIEAMACGTPVVSTDCVSGPAEILDSGKYGPLVPVGDVDALSKSIIKALQNPQDREILKERALIYSVDNATRVYKNLIDQVISSE